MILVILDYISVVPFLFVLSTIHSSIVNNNINELFFFFWMIGTSVIVELIKRIKYPPFLYNITRRPKGSYNTDFLSRNGRQPDNTPGFPSGHMAITTLYCYIKILKLNMKNVIGRSYYILIIILMGVSRYFKKCHNLVQILFGSLFGLVSGITLIRSKLIKLN